MSFYESRRLCTTIRHLHGQWHMLFVCLTSQLAFGIQPAGHAGPALLLQRHVCRVHPAHRQSLTGKSQIPVAFDISEDESGESDTQVVMRLGGYRFSACGLHAQVHPPVDCLISYMAHTHREPSIIGLARVGQYHDCLLCVFSYGRYGMWVVRPFMTTSLSIARSSTVTIIVTSKSMLRRS